MSKCLHQSPMWQEASENLNQENYKLRPVTDLIAKNKIHIEQKMRALIFVKADMPAGWSVGRLGCRLAIWKFLFMEVVHTT